MNSHSIKHLSVHRMCIRAIMRWTSYAFAQDHMPSSWILCGQWEKANGRKSFTNILSDSE